MLKFLNKYGIAYPGSRLNTIPEDELAEALVDEFMHAPDKEIRKLINNKCLTITQQIALFSLNKLNESWENNKKTLVSEYKIGPLLWAIGTIHGNNAAELIEKIVSYTLIEAMQEEVKSSEESEKFPEASPLLYEKQIKKMGILFKIEQQKVEALKKEREALRKKVAR